MLKLIWLYLTRNKTKVISQICLVALGVIGLGILSSLFLSFGTTREKMLSGPFHWVEVIITPYATDQSLLEDKILKAASEIDDISRVIETDIAYLNYNLFGAANGHMPIYGMSLKDQAFFLEKTGLTVSQEIDAASSPRQILVPESFLKANGLHVGEIYKETGTASTTGVYDITASLAGDLVVGIGQRGIGGLKSVKGFLFFGPKELLTKIELQLKDKLKAHGFSVLVNGPQKTISSIKNHYGSYYSGVWGVTILISLIFALGLSLFNASEIKSRQREFSIMRVTGWTETSQYVMALAETFLPVLIGWFLGVFGLSIGIYILQRTLFLPHGLFLETSTTLLLLTLILPGTVILSSLYLLQKAFKRDIVAVLQGSFADEKKEKTRKLWRNLRINWLRYPFRTGAYKTEIIGLTCFVATIIFFGLLSTSMTSGILDSGEIFKTITLVELNTTFPSSKLDAVSAIPGVRAADLVTFERIPEKLILGQRDIYAIAMPKSSAEILFPRNVWTNGLVLSTSMCKRTKSTVGSLFSLGDTEYIVQASSLLPGSVMLLLEGSLHKNAVLVWMESLDRDKVNESLNKLFFNDNSVEAIIDYTSIQRELSKSTQFIKFLITVITWLLFFVILVISTFSIWRGTMSRQKELAIKTLIGIDKRKVLKDTLLEKSGTIIGALILGFLLGELFWVLFSQLIFKGVYVSFSLNLKTVVESLLLSSLMLSVTAFVVNRTMTSHDPLMFVK